MNSILRVALYERVSTDEQNLRGFSIAAQIANLEEFCKNNNMRIVDHYTDAGVSGGKPAFKRPHMSRLLEDVQAGKIDMVLFTKLDRWFRNIKEYFKVQEILEKNHVEWKAIHEDYDTTTANGRMAITIFLAIAENEREKGSERVKAVFENKRKNKEACFGGGMPLGYKKEKDEAGVPRLVIDPETEPIMREFWRIVSETNNVMAAGRHINSFFGLRRAYKDWRRAFNNELYRGEWKGVKGFCPAYIDPVEWEQLNAGRPIKQAQNNRCYLFTGLLKCPSCGAFLSATYRGYTSTSGEYSEYYSYRCRRINVDLCSNHKRVSEIKLEKWLLENVKKRLEDFLQTVEVEAAAPRKKPKRNKDKINERIRRLNVVYMGGGKSDEEYMEELAELKLQLAAAEKEAADENKERDLAPLREFLTSDFEAVYSSLEREEKRLLWRSIIDYIVMDGNTVTDIKFKT